MKTSQWLLLSFLLVMGCLISLSSCRKEKFATGSDQLLDFQDDTVFFDTVFASIGSTTQYFKIYNNHSDPIKISSIELEGGNPSPFRINVDGESGPLHTDIELAENDSLFILLEVTVNPNDLTTPFVVEDRLLFETNGQEQSVLLTVWGQNAIFHGSPVNLITDLECDSEWNANLPHVVYGIVRVPEGCNLEINAGTQVYCHANSGIWVDSGTIDINGELGNEVCIQGDRLEPIFSDEPGQWGIQVDVALGEDFSAGIATITRGGIWITESEGNTIDYAIIKNGVVGVQVDTLSNPAVDALVINNTRILNMSAVGLLGQGASMSGYNNLVGNCGQTCAQFAFGGSYRFDHCTFANYWSFGTRQTPTFVLNNNFQGPPPGNTIFVRDLVDTQFRNCIMYGNNANLDDYNEFVVNVIEDMVPPQNFVFDHCLVDSDEDLSDGAHYISLANGATPQFVDPLIWDFHLNYANNPPSSLQGLVGVTTEPDLDGVFRSFTAKGCFEPVP